MEEAEAIASAAKAILEQGATLYTIAKQWNAAGILPTGNKRDGSGERARWTIATVGHLLRSHRIAGIVTVDGTPRPDIVAQWAAIITPDRQRAMAAAIAANNRVTVAQGRRPVNLMSGIATCGVCVGNVAG